MDLVLPLALRVGLLLYCLIVPGWALLRAAGFSSASALDRLLACLTAGAASTEFDGHDPPAGRLVFPSHCNRRAARAARLPRVELCAICGGPSPERSAAGAVQRYRAAARRH